MARARDRASAETPATRWLRANKVEFSQHAYDYVDRGGTAESSRRLGVDEHHVIKTLVMETQDEARRPLVVLMHGDRQVDTKELARAVGAKSVAPCRPETAQRHSGYQVGGTSPFGLRKPLPVYVEAGVLELEQIFVNGGRRGLLVCLSPEVLVTRLGAVAVTCAI